MGKPTLYLDTFHTQAMTQILAAFENFNAALGDISSSAALGAEVADLVVTANGEDYIRCFYLDGEAYIEPIFNPLREIAAR